MTSRRLVIAIDCDDVLIESTVFLVDAYNENFGTSVTLEHAHSAGSDQWGVQDTSLILERLTAFQHTAEYAKITPIKEAIDAVRLLAKQHELHLVTARDKSAEKVTMTMLDEYLKDCFTTIEHVGKDRPKGEVCEEIGADVLIDDNLKHLVDALEHGMAPGGPIRFGQYPWNQSEELPSGIVACHDWSAVLREIDYIAGR